MTTTQTRIAALGRTPALAILLALLLLIGVGLSLGEDHSTRPPTAPGMGDVDLYRAIDMRMLHGEGYYQAAATEQRARGYPLRPFVTVRMPTLAWITTLAGGPARVAIIETLLAAICVGMTVLRLRKLIQSDWLWACAALLVVTTVAMLSQSLLAIWHELWAGLLVALSLACWSQKRWAPSVAFGLAAVLLRELALPYLVAMAALALLERRPREALAWSGAILLFGIALFAHAHSVGALLQATDRASPGWSRMGGWRFDLALVRGTSLLATVPTPVTAIMLPIALLGWAAWPSRYAAGFGLTLVSWLGAFLLIGRPENFYWGLLMAPLLPIGVVMALPALRDLIRALAQRAPSARLAPQ